jgi:acetylornithine deacetylase/succinyl-diaminopimelate desuccinylase-like protein
VSGFGEYLGAVLKADLEAYCAENRQRFLDELIEALRIPSISANPGHAADVRRNAEYFAQLARNAGFDHVELLETGGHPAVYAERIVDAKRPTVLVYGHHDVQPTDPLEEWQSPPFEPEVREGNLYARGAVDDKGQVFMHLKAFEAHMQTRSEIPVNLKLLVEGEEESGSANFEALVVREKARLACDVAVTSDTGFVAADVPSMITSLRGLAGLEVILRGPELDLHSGSFGGAVVNPAETLAHIVAGLKDSATGRVQVEGFYDDVCELTALEREQIARIPVSDGQLMKEAGNVSALAGEQGFSNAERRGVRPTLEINGLWGGYQGPGSKTIIPAFAGVKITCRLVPDQDPKDILAKLRAAIKAAVPAGITAEINALEGSRPVVTSTDHPAVAAAADVLEEVFGKPSVFAREGGSIPPVEIFQTTLGVPNVLLGFALPDCHAHAPNEKFNLEQFQKGIRVIAHLWDRLAEAL